MERFIEIQRFGFNFVTFVFFATLAVTLMQSLTLNLQRKKIVKHKSGESVSFIFYCYFSASVVSMIYYGWAEAKLAMLINGFMGFLGMAIVISLLRYKTITKKEKKIAIFSLLILPIMIIFSAEKDYVLLFSGSIVVLALFRQLWELARSDTRGSLHPWHLANVIFSNSIWLTYSFFANVWPMKIFNITCLSLWITILLIYWYKPKAALKA